MRKMEQKWEYCTLVTTQTIEKRQLQASILHSDGVPEGLYLGHVQLGAAIALLGADGWEMCGLYSVPLADGLGQQFYFKRPLP